MDSSNRETILVKLSNESIIRVEATCISASEDGTNIHEDEEYEDEDISFSLPSFKEVRDTIEGVAYEISASFQKVKPSKATVEFGLELETDKKSLTAKLVPLSGKMNLKITLEWSEENKGILSPSSSP